MASVRPRDNAVYWGMVQKAGIGRLHDVMRQTMFVAVIGDRGSGVNDPGYKAGNSTAF